MKALIFAAGLGTRLKPLTDTMPKAMVPVQGEPLLAHVLRKLKHAGCKEAVVNVHHFADQISDYLATHDFGLSVSISDERDQLLETGGGIKKAAHLLGSSEPFLVHNVDILSNLDLAAFYALHKPERLATLLVSERETQRYLLFNAENRLVGWTNIKTGEVKSPYADLDVSACQKLAFAGIHVISPAIFPLMESWQGQFSIIDFYLSVAASSLIIGEKVPNLQLVDVGKMDSLEQADAFLTQYSTEVRI